MRKTTYRIGDRVVYFADLSLGTAPHAGCYCKTLDDAWNTLARMLELR